jgi:hypothetical protein
VAAPIIDLTELPRDFRVLLRVRVEKIDLPPGSMPGMAASKDTMVLLVKN